MTEESLLLEKSRQGDQQAYRRLYELHVDALYRFLRQFSKDHNEVEEWVQRTFIKAFHRIDSFAERSRFSTWIFGIGINEMRADRRRGAILPFEPVESAHSIPGDDSADHFHWQDLMKSWVNELDEAKRAVFLLSEVEGYSHAEIGEMLGIQESTSRTILTRAKQSLRKKWEQERREAG